MRIARPVNTTAMMTTPSIAGDLIASGSGAYPHP
jgi:hypothetical protein